MSLKQTTLLKAILWLLAVDILGRALARNIVSLTEFALICGTIVLIMLNTFLQKRQYTLPRQSLWLILLWAYLAIHFLFSLLRYAIFSDMPFPATLQADILQFNLSLLGFFMPILFVTLTEKDVATLRKAMIAAMKFAAIYTIVEQLLSLAGLRNTIEQFYHSAGIVSANLLNLRLLGIYRVWGIVGSSQLLGIVHLIFLFILLSEKKLVNRNQWIGVASIALLLSTSKTAYLAAVIVFSVFFMIYNKKHAVIFLLLLAGIVSVSLNSSDIYVINFWQSINSYINTIFADMSETSVPLPPPGGPVASLASNLQETFFFFGSGITYSYAPLDALPPELQSQSYFTSDYYLIDFTNQFGLIGLSLYILVFFATPLYRVLFVRNGFSDPNNYVILIFFLACLHYSPLLHKFIMFYVGFSIWHVYLRPEQTQGSDRRSSGAMCRQSPELGPLPQTLTITNTNG